MYCSRKPQTSKLVPRGKHIFRKKIIFLHSINFLEILEKILPFQSFLDQSEPQAKTKNNFKENLCCSKLTSGHWLLSTQSAS